ncbi:MAG: histidine kinase [Microbacteriaceae bacterium]
METTGDFDADWRRERPDARAVRTDALVAIALFVGTLISVWLTSRVGMYTHPAPIWQCVIWAALTALPLAWRRVAPITITCVIGTAFVVGQLMTVPELLFSNITFFTAFYSIGAWSTRRTWAMLARVAIIAAIFIWLFCSLILGTTGESNLSTVGAMSPYLAYGLIRIVTNLLYFGAAYAFGDNAFRSARQQAALKARTRELVAERERSAEQAVSLERVRIARELHDVVAHHVSVMGVQAAAARRVLGTDPERASHSLSSIEDSARAAVDELHLLLGALRDDDGGDPDADDPGASTSTRGLDQLPALAADATAAGLPVRFSVIGDPVPVPSTIQLSAYRVAQEALTNTRKHGGRAARADVRVRYRERMLEIEVSDTGLGATPPPGETPSGLGQIGMRERVLAVGGSIRLGAKPRGGYLVRATFPLAPPAEERV